MDFSAAMGILQQRSAAPMEPAARPPGSDGTTATTGDATMQCTDCIEDEDAAKTAGSNAAVPKPPSDVATLSDSGLLRLFLTHQEERVAVYRKFEDGFLLFLSVAEAEGYPGLVQRTTATFAIISLGVNQVEAELKQRGPAAQALAPVLRRVQTLEKEKLELTARLQILRHQLAVDELQAEKGAAADAAERARAARHGVLRAEEAKEVGARLDAVRDELNEAIDEVRCELAEGELADDEQAEQPAPAEAMAVG